MRVFGGFWLLTYCGWFVVFIFVLLDFGCVFVVVALLFVWVGVLNCG